MCIDARACLLSGTTTVVAPRETDLLLSIFVLAIALAFYRCHVTRLDAGQMVLQGCRAGLGLVLPSYPIMHEFPDSVVASVGIIDWQIVPKQILDVKLMILVKVDVELQDEEIHQVVVFWALSHQ